MAMRMKKNRDAFVNNGAAMISKPYGVVNKNSEDEQLYQANPFPGL